MAAQAPRRTRWANQLPAWILRFWSKQPRMTTTTTKNPRPPKRRSSRRNSTRRRQRGEALLNSSKDDSNSCNISIANVVAEDRRR